MHHDDVDHHRAVLADAGVEAVLTGSNLPTGAIVVISDGSVRTMLTSRGANTETGPESVGPASARPRSGGCTSPGTRS